MHTPDSTSITVLEAGELWLTKSANKGLEPSTVRQRRQHLDLHIKPMLGGVKLSKLTPPMVESFCDKLLENRSQELASKVLVSLKALLKEARRRELVSRNAASDTKIAKAARHEDKVRIPAKSEVCGMLELSTKLWPATRPWRALLVTAMLTGLRLSELRGLTWTAVDLTTGILRVTQRADFRGTIGSPKSKAGKRTVPLMPMARNTLRAWKLACPKTEGDLVFPGGVNGKILRTDDVHRRCWRPLLRSLGLEDSDGPRYTFHSLRHVAASLMIESGMQPKKLQAIMGHSSIKLTYDVYGHLWASAEDDAAAMEQAEKRLFS